MAAPEVPCQATILRATEQSSVVYQNGTTVPKYTIPLRDSPQRRQNDDPLRQCFPAEPRFRNADKSSGWNGGGTLQSSAVESSTVDLATELTTMIEAQNNYQADSKVFNTGSQLLQVLINLAK